MSDEELAEHWSGWRENTGNWFLCEMEVKRRQNKGNEVRGWLALMVALLSLFISIFTSM